MTDIEALVAAGTGERRVLHTDHYDDLDWEQARANAPKVRRLGDDLAEANWTGPALLGDVWSSLVKARPKLRNESEVARTHRINHRVMGELMEDDSWRELRRYTVGDPFGSTMAVATMGAHLADLYRQLAPAQEAADAAEAAQAELDQAEAEAGDGPLDDEAQASLDRLRVQASAAGAAADEALDAAAPGIGRAVRLATGTAADNAAEEADAAAGWGLGPGELGKVDPTERQRLAKLLGSDRLRRIAELLGRMRNLSFGEQSTRYDPGPDEIHDVILSDDLARLVPSELTNLLDDDLEDLFWLRFAERQLLTYELRETHREAKGSIVYVEDNSDSMTWAGGDRELWARATGLALLDIAVRQGRRFVAIVFSSAGQMATFDFDPASRDTNRMLDYASVTFHGGTDFAGPLDAAIDILDSDAGAGRCDGDIVFATDGDAKVSDAWLARWADARNRLGFTCYGINIGGDAAGTLDTICDGRVAEVHRLVDGDDTRDIFRSINKENRK